jgi:pimeloyl-ACP methyl ester carboxylesterase
MNRSKVIAVLKSSSGALALSGLAAATTAVWVEYKSRQAERQHPPTGHLMEVAGSRIHYVERGEGPPVVLLHGNLVSLADFEACGLIDALAKTHRVIAFDRPGFGHSSRPRDRLWTPSAQASVMLDVLARLGVERPVVVGHSMGCALAVAMALNQPEAVGALVLIGGYFYPNVRVDALLTAPVALPVLGDIMRYTVTALTARASVRGLVKGMFAPRDVPDDFFERQSSEMMVRPSQLRANAEDAAFMIPTAMQQAKRYWELRMPVTVVAGEKDIVVAMEDHTCALHREVKGSKLVIVPGSGHMVHYTGLGAVVDAVNQAHA